MERGNDNRRETRRIASGTFRHCHDVMQGCALGALLATVPDVESESIPSEICVEGTSQDSDDYACYEVVVERLMGHAAEAFLSHSGLLTSSGLEALGRLCQLVTDGATSSTFIAADNPLQSFSDTLRSMSASQAALILQLLKQILSNQLSNSCCFKVLLAAHNCGSTDLAGLAANMALSSFEKAVQLDSEGLAAMPNWMLGDLVSCDNLKVSSEMAVFEAIEFWVSVNAKERRQFLPDLLAKGLRFGSLPLVNMDGLEHIDRSPMLSCCPEAVGVFATIYTCYISDLPLGPRFSSTPRKGYLQGQQQETLPAR